MSEIIMQRTANVPQQVFFKQPDKYQLEKPCSTVEPEKTAGDQQNKWISGFEDSHSR